MAQFLSGAYKRQILELRIMGATGRDRYTERLAGTDLSRVLYGYGSEDMIVGRLTEDEVGFLSSSGAGSSRSTAATSRSDMIAWNRVVSRAPAELPTGAHPAPYGVRSRAAVLLRHPRRYRCAVP